MTAKPWRTVLTILGLYLLCSLVKDVEFLFIKTDQTILAENILCKLLCLGVIALSLRHYGWKWRDIGFTSKGMFKGMGFGFALGAVTFSVSYLAEYLVLRQMGEGPRLAFFITNFTLSAQNVTGVSALAVLICILGNVVNVWAEEGLFRGLLFKLGRQKLSCGRANLLQALLFGLWHIISVAVWVQEGSMTIPMAALMALGYVLLGGVLAYEWGLCALLTGTVWTGVFEHFFNNFVSNAVHMVSAGGLDTMQVPRIVLSNVLSLAIVLTAAKITAAKQTKTGC